MRRVRRTTRSTTPRSATTSAGSPHCCSRTRTRPRTSSSSRLLVRTERTLVQLHFTGAASRAEFDEAVATVGHWYHSFEFDNGYRVRGQLLVASESRGLSA